MAAKVTDKSITIYSMRFVSRETLHFSACTRMYMFHVKQSCRQVGKID